MSFRFFDALFPHGDGGQDLGYVAVSVFPGGGKYTDDPAKGPTQNHFFAWPSAREDLVAWCLHNSDKDVYVVPSLFKERGTRTADNICGQWAAYADADTLDLKQLRLEPTLVVETSPGRHHLYWVTSTNDPEALVSASRAIAHTHAPQGCDPSAWDATHLLRVPGTSNTKRGGDEVKIVTTGPTYALDRLTETYPEVAPPKKSGSNEMPPKSEWYYSTDSMDESAAVFRTNPDIFSMYSEDLKDGQDRSRTMWRLLSELSRADCSRATAMHIAWDARCNKYRIDGRPEEELWVELCKAFNDPDNRPVKTSFDAARKSQLDLSDKNPENVAKDFANAVTLLSEDERREVPYDTFIDRYQAWAMTRTDAPDVYHRAGAVTLLTAVLGEFGACPTKFDSNLTLWFLLLGPTTRARKTTSMMLWVDLLRDLEDERYPYFLGSDVTPEVLMAVLPRRNGRTSLYYRDEAHGLLYEQDRKRYLTGLPELMTELHGGRARSRMRMADVDSEDSLPGAGVRTNFMVFLCGTLDQVTSALTISDYQSGYLARFLVAEASPPPMRREDMDIEQYDGVDLREDPIRQSLINDLSSARSYWTSTVGGVGRTRIIPFSSEAWSRLMDVRWDIYQTAKRHEMAEVLLPTTDRMGGSVMKCAILLAMAERRERVEMRHIIKAISLAEDWYRATATIAGRILHSDWSSRQEEILTAIKSRTDGITQQELYGRFRTKLQEKEIEGGLGVLAKAGLIRKIHDRGRVRYMPESRL